MQKLLLPVVILIILISGFIYFNPQYLNTLQPKKTLPTYFTYSPNETNEISSLKSDKKMGLDEIYALSKKMMAMATTFSSTGATVGKTSISNLGVYIAVAQRDAAYLSYNTHQKYVGTLAPVTKKVICMFEPVECKKFVVDTDEYSEKVADIVMKKIQDRVMQSTDSAHTKEYKPKEGNQYWQGPSKDKPYKGAKVSTLSWLGFDLAGGEFLAPTYVLVDTKELLTKLNAQTTLTEEQKQLVKDIEAQRYGTNPGMFEMYPVAMTAEMRAQNYDLGQYLLVYSIERMMQADMAIMVNHVKYITLAKRPYQRLEDEYPKDPLLETISKSSTSSYPSHTAGMVGSNGDFLNYIFPGQKAKWEKMGNDLNNNDIYQGDHFTIDVELTTVMGNKIGQKAIKMLQQAGGLPVKTEDK